MHQIRFSPYSAPPDSLSVFKGATPRGRKAVQGGEGKKKEREKRTRGTKGEEKGKGGEGKGEKERGRDLPDHCQTASYAPAVGAVYLGAKRPIVAWSHWQAT